MNKFVRAEFSATAEPAGDRRVRFVVSTGGVNRSHVQFDPAGWDLAAYRRNPVVLLAHDVRSLPIGRAHDVGVSGDRLLATIEFTPPEVSELGDRVHRLVRAGFLRGVSVGALLREAKYDPDADVIRVSKQELAEISVVAVGADADALVAAALTPRAVAALSADAARAETHSRVLAHCRAEHLDPKTDYKPALLAVLKADPSLKARYCA